MPLHRIFYKLAKNKQYRRRRESKAFEKEVGVKSQLKLELKSLDEQINKATGGNMMEDRKVNEMKKALEAKIANLKQIVGLEKRLQETIPE